MTDTPARIRPFGSGSERMDWMINNCDKCKKGYVNDGTALRGRARWNCAIEYQIDRSYLLDGKMPREVALRAGLNQYDELDWRCKEFEAK
jgi:hypothetical protein